MNPKDNADIPVALERGSNAQTALGRERERGHGVIRKRRTDAELTQDINAERGHKPSWLKVTLPTGEPYQKLRNITQANSLNTVCESAACPNRGECWARSTATLMILGNVCTRSCGFCNVITGRPTELDLEEPARVAQAVKLMGLKYAVITSVNRDELVDGGASVWAETIRKVRDASPATRIEVLIPDFCGNWDALATVLSAQPDVLNHNVETIERLYLQVRPQAQFERSLELLRRAKEAGFATKSGFMVGLGETNDEVVELLQALKSANVDLITIGQYMQPTQQHLPIDRWVTPETFEYFHQIGMDMGFREVFSGPLVRSSYHAEEQAARV